MVDQLPNLGREKEMLNELGLDTIDDLDFRKIKSISLLPNNLQLLSQLLPDFPVQHQHQFSFE